MVCQGTIVVMLPHNHNGSLTFLVNLNSVTSKRK